MKRTLLAAAVVASMTLAGCGSGTSTVAGTDTVAPQPTAAATTAPATGAPATGAPATEAAPTVAPTPAEPGAKVAGIPALSGTPTDLKAQSSGLAGTGQPPTQLLTQDVVVGKGPAAKASDTVSVRYSGTLYDGTPFDASWKQGDTPVSFPLNQVVPGFALGIEGMQPGGRRVMVIPPALGYGEQGSPPVVPGNSTLVFVVDLVGIG